MGTGNQESPDLRVFSPADEAPRGAEPAINEERAALDARVLVERMIAAGDWPTPELLQQIVDSGDAAVEPLHDVLRARPHQWPGIGSLSHAIGLLSHLRRPETVPELMKIVEEYDDETCSDAAYALIDFGMPGFDALINLSSNATLRGYQRAFALQAAVNAAGNDQALRKRVADVARAMLAEAIDQAREERKLKGSLEKLPPDDDLEDENDHRDEFDEPDDVVAQDMLVDLEDDLAVESDEELLADETDSDTGDGDEDDDGDDDDFGDEPLAAEKVGIVVTVLAHIADPLARDTINSVFDEGLVDESLVTRKYVDEHYGKTGEPREAEFDFNWLDAYRDDYVAHIKSLNPPAPASTPRSKYRYEDRYDEGDPPLDIPATAPIRNTGPRTGRNDPCWCGSGKKYKKCHLGKEPPA